uniref:Uncharacterized protein n=1 Tax=Myripristis murdjan TaxID=586833 RepID=A0A667XD35_9TELE
MEKAVLGIYVGGREGAEVTDPPEDVGIIVEGCAVLQDLRDMANGCACLFGLIYCLNLSYPKDLRYTFEFLQKVLMGLDGNKLSTKVQVLKNKLHNCHVDVLYTRSAELGVITCIVCSGSEIFRGVLFSH